MATALPTCARRTHIHTGFWFLKGLLWLGTLIGFFFVPSGAIYGFAQVARVLSGLFLILQVRMGPSGL